MSEPKQDQSEETGDTSEGAFDPMTATMNGIQTSLGFVMQNLAQNLQNNMEAVRSLGDTLDKMIQSNIIISSHLKPIKDAVQLTVRIENKTNFPLVHVNGDYLFDPVQDISVEHTDSYLIITDEDNSNEEVEEAVPSLFEEGNPTYLLPNSKYEDVSIIRTEELTWSVGSICLSFPHPTRGDGEEIYVEEQFGLYVIDQLIKSETKSVPDVDDDNTKTIKRTYNVKFIREMMNIHPIKGMEKDMCIALSGKKVRFLSVFRTELKKCVCNTNDNLCLRVLYRVLRELVRLELLLVFPQDMLDYLREDLSCPRGYYRPQ
ncbi:hypothetical protein K501DRAFT_331638 [Backusella circina FSU 941]|nr:hypothetical protein K501DRAFT_331638 [Backusella circina FSU 941]